MEVHEQDRYLPIANISRIMKRSIPPTAKISKDAKECVQECVSEFIAFITSEQAFYMIMRIVEQVTNASLKRGKLSMEMTCCMP